jgi:hypothetical protein
MNEENEPKLSFTCNFDERTAWEVEQKGWFEGVVVILPNGLRIPVSFWDPVRLSQDLETGLKFGEICLAEPGLIVLPKVTYEYMQKAIRQLFEKKYFDRLIALGGDQQ